MQADQEPITPPGNFDFLASAGKPAGPSKKQRIITVVGGAAVLILLVFGGVTYFQNANKPKSGLLVVVLQDQQEVIRVATIGSKKAKGTEALNYSATVLATIQSDQKTLAKLVGKVDNKILNAKQNSDTDKLLTNGEQTNRFDEVMLEKLRSMMTQYRKDIVAAYDGNDGKKTRAALKQAVDNSKKLAPPETTSTTD